MNSTLAPFCAIAPSSVSGDGRSTSSVEAPMRSGNSSRPPSPNVNASGGLPVNTSSAVAFSIDLGQQSHAASRSRWKCIVPFGTPVVPDVKAMSAVSSAAVRTLSNVEGLSRARASRPSSASLANATIVRSAGELVCAARSSSRSRASQSATATRALSMTGVSSFARSSGIVGTAIAPALITANQHAAIAGVFGPRSSTRLPGTMRRSSTSTRA